MLLSNLSKRSLERESRDGYGFALRPQHQQTYREYAKIYKEEEEERSQQWKDFLQQHTQSSKQQNQEEIKSVLREHPHLEEMALSGKENGKRPNDQQNGKTGTSCSEAVKLKQYAASEEGEVTLEGVQIKPKEEIDSEIQDTKAEAEMTEVKHDAASELEHEETLQGKATKVRGRIEEGKHLRQTLDVKGSVLKEGKKNKEEDYLPSTHCATEKEEQYSKGAKMPQVERWGNTRPSLSDIEHMMSARVKKRQSVNYGKDRNGHNLPSTEPPEPSRVTDNEFEESVCINETSDDAMNITQEKSAAGSDRILSESLIPWKEKLKNLVRGGVPKDLRGEVWQAFVGVKARRVQRYYQELLAQGIDDNECKEHESSSDVAETWARQIEKDLPRTFPGHPALKEEGRESLRRLLLAYARHNPSVGYCQAMNFFAGLLLFLMPEENAFWTFVGIVDDYFSGYYSVEMLEVQVDQLVFEELMRERFPRLVNHLDYLGVQATWLSAPWFISIFINVLPWESVLRVWDVLLFEGNRVMLFQTALALVELYGPALITTEDAGDAIILLKSLAASTFDSSQLVLTACMGFQNVTEEAIEELRQKHRPTVLAREEGRAKSRRICEDSEGRASIRCSFNNEHRLLTRETKLADRFEIGRPSNLEKTPSNLEEFLNTLYSDSEVDSLPYLQEQVVRLKLESLRLLEERRSAVLRAEELEMALIDMVKHDNRRQLSARVEQLEKEVVLLHKALADKKEEEAALLKVLMQMEQEQRLAEEVRRNAEHQAATLRYTVIVLQEKYEKSKASLSQMKQRAVMAESMLEATTQYESGQSKAVSSSWPSPNQSSGKKPGLLSFGLSWRENDKAKSNIQASSLGSTSEPSSPSTPPKLTL